MTIYIPGLRELLPAEMGQLDSSAAFSVREAGTRVSAYVYDWADLRVVINVMPEDTRPKHLEQFVNWLKARSESLGTPLSTDLAARIQSTTIILGFVVEETTHRDVWHDRVQDMIGMICFNTKGILFWEGSIFDENCTQLWPTA
jgi:hypothetical protein